MAIRRSIYALSAAQVATFVTGIKAMKKNGDYDKLIWAHFNAMNLVHGTLLFLPWHRAFLAQMEQMLQSAVNDTTFGLPYWDWTQDVGTTLGALWSPNLLGGQGNPVTTGPFAGSNQWNTISPNNEFGDSLEREFGSQGAITTASQVLAVLNNSAFADFGEQLEAGPHSTMHMWVGGQISSVPNSPNDPAFWLHHANIDRIWDQWQRMYPNVVTQGPGLQPTTVMPPVIAGATGLQVQAVVGSAFSDYYYEGGYSTSMSWSSDNGLPNNKTAFGLTDSPALGVYGSTLVCLRQGRAHDGWIWGSTFDGTTWNPDGKIQGVVQGDYFGISSSPAVAPFNGTLYIAREGQGDSGWVWCATYQTVTFPWWREVGLIPNSSKALGTSGSPALAAYQGKLYCVTRARGDGATTMFTSFDGTAWADAGPLPSAANGFQVAGSPALAVFNGRLYCVRQGTGKNTGQLWGSSFDGASWTVDGPIRTATSTLGVTGSPALVNFNARLYCIRQGAGGKGWTWSAAFDGTSWSDDGLLPTATNAFGIGGSSPGLAVFNGALYCARQGRGDSGYTTCATATMNLPT